MTAVCRGGWPSRGGRKAMAGLRGPATLLMGGRERGVWSEALLRVRLVVSCAALSHWILLRVSSCIFETFEEVQKESQPQISSFTLAG